MELGITSSVLSEMELGNAANLRPKTGGSEIVARTHSAALTAPPVLSPRDRERYENSEVLQDASAHQVVQMSESRKTTTIKQGSIVFTWNQTNQKKVPYWIVPDGLADDPFFVEKVFEAMKLPAPNLILRFSRLKQPVHEWRSAWNFDFTADGYVEESALPCALPPGMSRATSAVQKYMSSVAKDRVLDILRSVSSACNQAGAWLQLSDFEPGDEPLGFYDHVAPLVGQAAEKGSVIFTTYSMEDRRTCPGGDNFCEALNRNAGVPGHEFPQMRPKPFHEDITSEMQTMGLIDKAADPAAAESANAKGRSGRGSVFDIAVEHFFKDRMYLPSKDLSHLLVFESKSTEIYFKQQLKSRTPIGNFIMQGSVAAMNMFASSIKTGAPVFVLNGTGGAADRISLLIEHMKWRKRLTQLGGAEQKEAKAQASSVKKPDAGGILSWGTRKRAKIEAMVKPEEATLKLKDIEDEDVESLTVKKLVIGLQNKVDQLQKEATADETAGDLVRVMELKSAMQELRKCLQDGQQLESTMLAYIQQETSNEEEKGALDDKYSKLRERVMEVLQKHGRASRVKHVGGKQNDDDKIKERTRNLTVLLPRSKDPPEFYSQQMRRGKEGVAWEKKVGMRYEEWLQLPEDQKGDENVPPEWPVLWIGNPHCRMGNEDGVPVMCKQQTCPKCFAAQDARRKFLRGVALWNKDWLELSLRVRQDYIRQWVANNPLSDDPSLIALCGQDKVAEISRVIFSNVNEPPVPDAVVVVETLDVNLSVEEVMDKVTLAMSTDALVSEVGERRAFRERLLEAWKMVKLFKYNAGIQNRRVHLFNILIILFTFASVLVGTVSFQISTILSQAEAASEEPRYPGFDGFDFQTAYDVLGPVNVALPLAATFLLALNSKFSPQNKYNSLITAMHAIESEIYQYRAKVGEYSAQGGLFPGGGGGADAGGEGGGNGKGNQDDKEPAKKKNPRTVFATRIDQVVSELGSSELKQQSLVQPANIDHLMPLDRVVCVQQHPSLFEEGRVLQSGNAKLVRDTIERYTRVVDDDGIRTISAQDYLDLRISPLDKKYQRRAPRFSRLLNVLQLLIFTATTLSTALGAFNYSQWIPVAMAFGASIGSVVAYTQLEARLQRVNTAIFAMSKLRIWWQRLSVIEQRIPHNKTFMVETAEAIIQSEAGCNLVNAKIEEAEGNEEGSDQKGKDSK